MTPRRAESHSIRRVAHRWLGPLMLVVIALAAMAGAPPVLAHVELERADPPIGGVVVAPPDHIELVFTGAVAPADPAPSLQLFDAEGEPRAVQLLPLSGGAHTVAAEIGDLDGGTYTVAWTVQSAGDGHILSGTYSFRVGVGVPPGMASTEGETPAPWAVATRWLTFLGIAAALAGFLFDAVVLQRRDQAAGYRRRRARLILTGAVVALLATLAEPILQTIDVPARVEVDLGSAVAGLPAAWWLRPLGLGLAAALGARLAVAQNGRLPRAGESVGTIACLLALAGLSLTSHSASEESWQAMAVLFNYLHQVAVALWTGGLVFLAVWWPFRDREVAVSQLSPLRHFSALALPLVAVALLTGLANTGFLFPLVEGIEAYGITPEAFATLWTSDYGVILLIKLLLLLVPLGLAIVHRAAITRVIDTATMWVSTAIGRTIRVESAAVAAVVLAGSMLALSAPPLLERPPLDEVVLTAPASTVDGAVTDVVHLSLDPAKPGENRLRVQVTDPYGEPIDTDPNRVVSVRLTSLEHDGVHHGAVARLVDPLAAVYTVDDVSIGPNGWWEITTTISRGGQESSQAQMHMVLPDPNLHGFDAPPERETVEEAEALFVRGLERMTSWTSVRTRERIASGMDAVAIIERAVSIGGERRPPAQTFIGTYSAGFAPLSNGELPAPPKFDFSSTVTIGEQGWRLGPDGTWLEASPTQAKLPAEWDNTYVGAEGFRLGITDEIDGEPVQVVTFYLPEQGGQAEAWFAWWVGTESGNVHQVAMVAQAHYMLVEYSGIDEPIQIEAPMMVATPAPHLDHRHAKFDPDSYTESG